VTTDAPEWDDAVHRLKFIFGEYCFYSTWFEAAELSTHFTRLEGSFDESGALVAPVLDRYRAAAIPSHPIIRKPAWLKMTRGYLRYVPAAAVCYFIEPAKSFEEYLQQMRHKHRHELLRKRTRVAEHNGGEIDLRTYRSLPEARAFYALATAVSRKTYQHRLLDVGLPETAAFQAELLTRAEGDTMRGYLLFHHDTPIAYGYCTVRGDCLRFQHIGYDPAYRNWSVGNVLIAEALRCAIGENRFAIVDFGSGEAQYKRVFATGSRRCATVFFFRPTLGRLLIVAAHRACTAVSDVSTTAADRLGIREGLKRYARIRAAAAPGPRLRSGPAARGDC
jgi:CelD/BcsL family acetyltransferase involved in cellulose biosynthesis